MVELVMVLEDEDGIGISDEDAEKMATVGDAVRYIEGRPAMPSGASKTGCRGAREEERTGQM